MASPRQQPSCFIGSSKEGLPYAVALVKHLEAADVQCEQWNISTFALGQTTIESLEAAVARNSFAVLIATADDTTTVRKKRTLSPRDNIVFEFGLFAGRLGRSRAFLLVPDDVESLKLPTDLLGVTLGLFKTRATTPARLNSMRTAAEAILKEVERQGVVEAPSDPELANALLLSLPTQLMDLRRLGRVSFRASARTEWVDSVMAAVLEPFLARTEDAYSEWLRPDDARKYLNVVASTNLDDDHKDHRWKPGEGIAGRVWTTGVAVGVDSLRSHPWFKHRPGCENETYICTPIGRPGGPEGVLAVGSDNGFDVRNGDAGLLRAYGQLLALVT